MKMLSIVLLLAIMAAAEGAERFCKEIDGASIIAEDGQFLGRIESRQALKSTFNDYGLYGGRYGIYSIWNEYGLYGGDYGIYSPLNRYTVTPPILMKDGSVIGYLTVNDAISPSINPWVLRACNF